MKKIFLLSVLFLVACSNGDAAQVGDNTPVYSDNPAPPATNQNVDVNDSNGEPLNTQIRENGTYTYTISTPNGRVYAIEMKNGDRCYVLDNKNTYVSAGISCVK